MSREYRDIVEDIRFASEKIIRFLDGMSRDRFEADELTYDAILRNLEVIGEASKSIPPELAAAHEDIDWRGMAGLRDVVIHQYFGIDRDLIWDICARKIPELREKMVRILDN